MRYATLSLFCLLLTASIIWAQPENPPIATPADQRLEGFQQRQALWENSLVRNIKFENIGPTVFSGRVTDIDVNPDDPTHFYVAYASGGLWFTHNNGTTFEPLFDDEMVMTIGDIAVDWKNEIIWIGSGENNSSRSSYAGVGLFRSADKGKTWTHQGLPESHHIGRIILHPSDPNTLWVAALGHLYSPNEERGVFKSIDGGKSWAKVLYVNDNTGAIDLIIDPDNPEVLYASTWHRERRAWNFVESGSGSGIYKTSDGGENWQLLTTKESGFPTGKGVGRIGFDLSRQNGKTLIYALLDNYDRRPPEDKDDADVLVKNDLRDMTPEDFLKLNKTQIADFLSDNNFPKKYSADTILTLVKEGVITPLALVEYLEDANSLLFDTPVIGAEVYLSEDEGKSWKKTHDNYIDRLYNSYGYYFGCLRVSPLDDQKVYITGVPILRSADGGKEWKNINGDNVHVDHHALWISPERAGHLILGNDGGINISYDDGENWIKCNSPSVGQFYTVAIDMAEPYNVYGGLQDNGVWKGAHTYEANTGWHGSGRYPYQSILGGDGMQIQVDFRDNKTVYTGFQFGNYYRLNSESGKRKRITPKHELGQRPFRWNWQSPIHLSRHNQDIVYFGANVMHRSLDQGDSFKAISGDLTKGGIKGDVAFGTLTSIDESPLQFGLIYTGSDDGLIHVSPDGGVSWNKISDELPQDLWVSRVEASNHDKSRVYCALNGYRWDHFDAYVYRSDDQGASWIRIGTDLPAEPVNVVLEDPVNEDIIYVGTDHGLYISLNRGETFMGFGGEMPRVPVHDLVIQPREKHLLVGTHGRSFYKADIAQVQTMDAALLDKELHVFAIPATGMRASSGWGNRNADWAEFAKAELDIIFYAGMAGTVDVQIRYGDLVLFKDQIEAEKGVNYYQYSLKIDPDIAEEYEKALQEEEEKAEVSKRDDKNYYLGKGTYTVTLSKGSEKGKVDFKLK